MLYLLINEKKKLQGFHEILHEVWYLGFSFEIKVMVHPALHYKK